MTMQNLLEWQNLVFALPMVLAFILLGMSILGGGGDHDVGADHDISIDHDVSLDAHDIDLDSDADVGGGHGANLPHDFSYGMDHDAEVSIITTMLSVLGIGKVPISILGFCWLMIFGFVGLSFNAIWTNVFGSINVLVMVSAAVAFVASLTVTSFLAGFIARIMPLSNNDSESIANFINREADVRYTITPHSGTITLKDKFDNLQTLPARCDSSFDGSISPNTKVIILSYSKDKNEFIVIPKSELNK